MFENIFDSIFILIPLAIIIGRFILQARSKHKPAPPRPAIPIHFEDDEDEDKPRVRKGVKGRQPEIPVLYSERLSSTFPEDKVKEKVNVPKVQAVPKMPEAAKKEPVIAETQARNDFFMKLNKLSPLKQAVIMAEVLGPPKALQ